MIRKGRIIGLFREKGSGLAILAIDDDLRGKTLIPCEGNPTSRAFDEAFGPGFINGVSTDNSVIAGESIYYTLDSIGILETFTPEERAPAEMVEEYEAAVKEAPAPRKAGHIGFVEPDDPRIPKDQPSGPGVHKRGGFLPPDHPLYGTGPIVAGKPIVPPPKKARFINEGLCKPDDPIYSTGPIVAGRPILQPRRPYTAEDSARDFKIVRDAITKDGWKPGYVYVAGKWEPPGKQGESEKKGGRR